MSSANARRENAELERRVKRRPHRLQRKRCPPSLELSDGGPPRKLIRVDDRNELPSVGQACVASCSRQRYFSHRLEPSRLPGVDVRFRVRHPPRLLLVETHYQQEVNPCDDRASR